MTAHRQPRDTPALEPHWFQILLALADRDLHGLGIMNEVLERTGGRMRLWPAMLYRNLARLVDLEMVIEVEAPAGRADGGRAATILPHHRPRPARLRRRSAAARRLRRSRAAEEPAEGVSAT